MSTPPDQPFTQADERRHDTAGATNPGELFGFDAHSEAISLYVRYSLRPALRRCWFFATAIVDGRPPVHCLDPDAALPSGPVLEIRSNALWSHAICETPWEHWTVAMEAFALALDDPADGWNEPVIGTRTGLAFDLEWERFGARSIPLVLPAGVAGYAQHARVTGAVQVGDATWEIDTSGARHHLWGDFDRREPLLGCDCDSPARAVPACWLDPEPGAGAQRMRHLRPDGWCNRLEP